MSDLIITIDSEDDFNVIVTDQQAPTSPFITVQEIPYPDMQALLAASEAARNAAVDAANVSAATATTKATEAGVYAVTATEASGAATAAKNAAELAATQSAAASTQAGLYAAQALSSKDGATASEELAQAWAISPEDIEVVEGEGNYSSLHWAAKSQISQGIAGAFATNAVDAAAAAAQARDDAVAVVTGGTASLTPAAGKLPIAGANGKIDQQWFDPLPGVDAEALHRSPNAVTAMFVYDTGKDSDGGAWTEKCQHTSWYNEAINGKWLGAHPSEFSARNQGATLGAEILPDPNLNSSVGVASSTVYYTIIDGKAVRENNANAASLRFEGSFSAGKTYRVAVTLSTTPPSFAATASGVFNVDVFNQGQATNAVTSNQTGVLGETLVFYIMPTVTCNRLGVTNITNTYADIEAVSVREVTALNTQSGDYYQSTVDGKFYRLWRNFFGMTEKISNAYWLKSLNNFNSAGSGTRSVTDNFAAAHDGQLIATRVQESSSSDLQGIIASSGAETLIGFDHVFTIDLKADTRTQAFVGHLWNSGTTGVGQGSWIVIDLTNGTQVVKKSGIGNADSSLVSCLALGGGWFRATVRLINITNNLALVPVFGPASGGVASYQGDGVSGILVARPHVQIGTTEAVYEKKDVASGRTSETFRGNKRDFPRLSAIVAEASNVTVYDLTEPGRPMWMRFAQVGTSSPTQYLTSGSGVAGVSAVNGHMVITGTSGFVSLTEVSFVKDFGGKYRRVASAPYYIHSPIGNRMSVWPAILDLNKPLLTSDAVNAVAMTVLPDAPVDPVTGLKVPTIAVATAGGVSVIRHDGSVKNLNVAVNQNRDIAFNGKTLYVAGVPSTNVGIYATTDIGGATIHAANYFSTFGMPQFDMTGPNEGAQFEFSPLTKLLASRPGNGGIRFLREHVSAGAKSIAAKITNQFNAGYNHGDIRRAYLADNTVGSVTGPELATINADFSSGDLTGWSTDAFSGFLSTAATALVVGGAAQVTGPAGNYGCFSYGTAFTTVPGRVYAIRYKQSNAARVDIRIGNARGGTSYLSATTGVSASPLERVYLVTATGTVMYVAWIISSGTVATFDDLSVREPVLDRSYKANGAYITGTLTKTEVASAAQLVAYSGFSAANYLQEPYSADLNFGVGEWSVGTWVNVPVMMPNSSFPAISADIITNGSFDTDTVWVKGAGWAIVDGVATKTAGTSSSITQGSGSVGKAYRVTWTVSGMSAGAHWATAGSATGAISTTNGTFSVDIVAVGTGSFGITGNGGFNGSIDNVSVVELGYSVIADRSAIAGACLSLGVAVNGRLVATTFDGTTTRTVTTPAAYNTATWLKAEACYTTDGTLAILVNGVQVAATRGNPLLTLNNANAVLTIGNSFSLDAPFPGSIALLKLSATVPTAEQAVWMYEQEKHLFQAGAQCCLPDAGAIADLTYDEATDKWIAISATNESEWSGLVRTSVTAVPAGSYTRAVAGGGVQLLARSTTSPGVDVTIPAYGLREELVKRAEVAARLNAQTALYDFVGGFTANTTSGNTAILSIANLTYPTRIQGARVTGTGIPANASIADVSGTTGYLSATATATGTAVQINLLDFALPTGLTATAVSVNGVVQREGPTAAYTRLFDGFREVIRFAVAPGNTAWVQIQTVRSVA